MRMNSTRRMPGIPAIACWSALVRYAVSEPGPVRRYRSAGRTRSSHWSSDCRNEATMIAIETIRLTAATIAARLTPAWPGAPRS